MTDTGDPGFSNRTGRPPGRLITLASRFVPAIRRVQEQIGPFAAYWGERNRAELARTGPLCVVLGDSMAQGLGATSPEGGWAGRLEPELPGWRLVNLSQHGARVDDVLHQQLPAALRLRPDLLICLIGSNDLMQPKHQDGVGDRYAVLLDRLPRGTVIGNQPGTFAAALQVNGLIDDAVRRRELVLAELRDPRTRHWRGKLASDRFHPNDRGYAAIAEVFTEALRRAGY
ncbi:MULTISPECIES: SGNH/GDSL hydrolase family protein [unclassified Pseudonocardia]|uniref:SGNH/GDSL hydrolase family protein n=1 Tax=unclassified Pseudonocardia TaxID=2619320 RepID=UPI0006CB328C|nr:MULTISPECIES: SGNH/GDSL hydrolase family protein [unclassified Pseudonocardia]ALE75067.1 esterase [Pseudonocardia sp. EC080625-04]ALL74419.1 esterase [Pseudonocardia sp. EC080610-09]ALL81441.1 esterase [Pseudonocardia sp. EC080619-01]